VKVQRQPGGVDDFPQRIPVRVPQRLQIRRVGDVEAAECAAPGDALDLGDGRFDRMVRDRSEAGEALGVRRAESGEPLVVDAQDLDGGLTIVQAAGGAQHTVEDLGLDAVTVLVLYSEVGIGQAADTAAAVFVQAGRGHAIGAMDLAGDVFPSRRTHAVNQTEIGAALGHPLPAVGPVAHVGHAFAHCG
jgi:hypothetical protein